MKNPPPRISLVFFSAPEQNPPPYLTIIQSTFASYVGAFSSRASAQFASSEK